VSKKVSLLVYIVAMRLD